MKWIDLRSDTVTAPTRAMREAMCAAPVGDDGRLRDGVGGDPTAVRVEAMVAALTGKEAALFAASGIMGNALALLAHTRRGDGIVVSEHTHVYSTEKGVFDPDLFGRSPLLVPADGPRYDRRALEHTLKQGQVKALVLENTHNHAGGAVLRPEEMAEVAVLCRAHGVRVHLDGARLFNAATALGVEVRALTEHADSVMFCVSKGLCAPVGSFVAGSAATISRVRELRKPLGGQMRQVGVLEAAAEVAITAMAGRLGEDHRRARALAEGLCGLSGVDVDPAAVQTNLVRLSLPGGGADRVVRGLAQQGVLAGAVDDETIRLVTHNDLDDGDIAAAVEAFCKVLG